MKPDAPTIAAGPAPPRSAPPTAAVPVALPRRIVYSVSRLNREVRSLLETGIGQLWVQGELSNLSRPASGHWYFSLKDRDAQVRCAMFRTRNTRTLFEPHEGQQVLARGRVSLYEPRGDYQLLVEQLEDAGLGALQRAFEELKQRLAVEGLFAPERKRPLPAAPRRIGVVTSPSGAAIRDILHILARRFPAASVIVYGVPVQGAAAAPAIVAALDLASARADCDVLILARGGGALEDLWAFNDERVARAIHRSRLPVVTGIGHEIDFTIADFVADLRAPTPSGAAELVVPDVRGWLQRLDQLQARFAAAARRTLQSERAQLRALRQRLQSSHPGARLRSLALRLDELERRAHFALQSRLTRLHSLSQRLDQLEERAQFALQARLASCAAHLQSLARALQAISPLSTLERGFAVITRSADGQLVTDAGQLAVGDSFEARLARGSVQASVIARRP